MSLLSLHPRCLRWTEEKEVHEVKLTGDTMEMMKAEAIRRMKLLKLHQNAIKEFEAEDKLNLSRGGFLYWLNDVQKKNDC